MASPNLSRLNSELEAASGLSVFYADREVGGRQLAAYGTASFGMRLERAVYCPWASGRGSITGRVAGVLQPRICGGLRTAAAGAGVGFRAVCGPNRGF